LAFREPNIYSLYHGNNYVHSVQYSKSVVSVMQGSLVFFQRLWHDNIEEPLSALLKILVPVQDQDRWYKSESSVLYTYALVSNKHLQMRYTECIEKTEQI
jgi:hypothetical protein